MAVYAGWMILAGIFTCSERVLSLYTFGRYLLTAGAAVVILGFLGMGVSGTGRLSDLGPIFRERKVNKGFIKKVNIFF